LTALDILPATRGYHQWDSMRDHVLPPRYSEKCCPPDSASFLSVSPTLSAYRDVRRSSGFSSFIPFPVHSSSPRAATICLPVLVKSVGARG